MEEWKYIDGTDKAYMISNMGKVKSMPRYVQRTDGKPYFTKERILRYAIDGNGYARLAFRHLGKFKTFKLHRLVAEYFCEKHDGKNEVNHINGNKIDNRAINLEWCNRSENMKHAFNAGLCRPNAGSSNSNASIDEIQALTVKTMIGHTKLANIARQMNISKNIVKDISRKKTWKHV